MFRQHAMEGLNDGQKRRMLDAGYAFMEQDQMSLFGGSGGGGNSGYLLEFGWVFVNFRNTYNIYSKLPPFLFND